MIAKHLDLNLLMIFDAILAEGHVTRAAERLAMSQSAVSKGLAQLRQAFGDPLFLRASRGVVPTHRALEIADQVRQAIAALNSLAGPVTEFDRAQRARAFQYRRHRLRVVRPIAGVDAPPAGDRAARLADAA